MAKTIKIFTKGRDLVKEDFRKDSELKRLIRYEVYIMYPDAFQ